MTPAITAVRLTGAARRAELPLLVLGPSLGTSATALWSDCAAGLTDAFDVLAWDLPGHGHNRAVPEEPLTIADLARGVLAVVDDVLDHRGETGGRFLYAGNSVGGAVGLQLLLDEPTRVGGAVLLCTGAQLGDAATWADRIAEVERSGTAAMAAGAEQRWFAPGFLDRRPEVGAALLGALRGTLDAGYVQVCRAVAGFDVRDRLGEVAVPVLAVAGGADVATPPALLEEIASGVRDGRLEVLADVAHLAPAQAPEAVAELVRRHLLGEGAATPADTAVLDPRSRALVTLAARAARSDDPRPHVRAALQSGLSDREVDAVLEALAGLSPEAG